MPGTCSRSPEAGSCSASCMYGAHYLVQSQLRYLVNELPNTYMKHFAILCLVHRSVPPSSVVSAGKMIGATALGLPTANSPDVSKPERSEVRTIRTREEKDNLCLSAVVLPTWIISERSCRGLTQCSGASNLSHANPVVQAVVGRPMSQDITHTGYACMTDNCRVFVRPPRDPASLLGWSRAESQKPRNFPCSPEREERRACVSDGTTRYARNMRLANI
jgi:hypothetical protein